MIPAQDYAASLLFGIEPTDRALDGWGDHLRDLAGAWLRADAAWQEERRRGRRLRECAEAAKAAAP
jgi:hypothetical protein